MMRWKEFEAVMDDLKVFARDEGNLGCSEGIAIGKSIARYIEIVKQEQRERIFFCLEHPEEELGSDGGCSRCIASDLLD